MCSFRKFFVLENSHDAHRWFTSTSCLGVCMLVTTGRKCCNKKNVYNFGWKNATFVRTHNSTATAKIHNCNKDDNETAKVNYEDISECIYHRKFFQLTDGWGGLIFTDANLS